MKSTRLLLAVSAVAVLLPAAAWSASHVKPGLWEVKVDTGQPMPDMSQMPPEVQAQMRAHGMQMMGGGAMIARHCVTRAEAAMDHLNVNNDKDCRVENAKYTGQSYSADMVCTGQMTGHGHVQMTFESPAHYSGTISMQGTAGGHPVASNTRIDAHFVSPDCGKLK